MVSLAGRLGYCAMPHRFPPIRHFERIAGEEDIDALNVIEALTDDRIRDEIGQIEVAPAHERFYGAHAELVMAAFAHWDADGGSFSDGSYGVFCLGLSEDTATARALHGTEAFLAATNEKPTKFQMSLHSFRLTGEVADFRAAETAQRRNSTAAIGRRLRAVGVAGVLLPSPFHDGGECVAAFKATVIAEYMESVDLEFNWNGERVDEVKRMIAVQRESA